ncbi:MAG TPA: TlpA disulfide reductase family protein [Polyangiaceae bacterium]|jgi:thiol-disulfide isomerase/thioredoxin|nr:TlpA disulfide reductase family protein [Polyangiaceae bacterium]
MSIRPHSRNDTRQGYIIALCVIVASLGFGLFGLPRIGKHVKRAESPLVGEPARDFMLKQISGPEIGKTQRLSDLQGKTVLLDFFASWCGPCREQAPIVERIAQRLSGPNLAVYGVNTSDQIADAEHYLSEHRPSYPVLFDDENQAASAFNITGLPTLLVIDKGGIVRALEMRVVGETELEDLIRSAQSK